MAAARTFSEWYVDRVTADRVRLCLARGDVEAASRSAVAWQGRFGSDDAPDYPHEMVYRALCRLSVSLGEPRRALPLLEQLVHLYTQAGAGDVLLEALILQAVARHACDRGREALIPLHRALALSAPEGYVRTFLDQGQAVRELLNQFVAAGGVPRADGQPTSAPETTTRALSHAARVLSAFAGEPAPTTPAPRPPNGLVEPLSEREREVLRLLAAGLSSTELADVLYISKNTARTHIRNI